MRIGFIDEESARPPLSDAERAAAFRHPPTKVPPKFVLMVVAVFVVLGIGGAVVEHLLSSIGVNPGSSAVSRSTSTSGPGLIAPPVSAPATPQVGAPLARFMGITPRTGAPAPGFSLSDQTGRRVSLADERGRVVVLTFFDAPCLDICPVVSAELLQASSDLGPASGHVAFLTVNSDPVVLSGAPAAAAALRTGLATVASWHFLTSNLGSLDAVWKAYGVSVNVARTSGLVAHNDVMCFIDPAGRLRFEATPFADESSRGAFSLPPASVARWGQGIATYARQLLGSTP